MKKLLFTISTFVAITCFSNCYSQNWTPQQLDILNQYGLEKTDPRGIVLISGSSDNCNESSTSVKEALEIFLSAEVKRDLSYFCIESIDKDKFPVDQPIDIFEIVKLYLETKN